MKHSFWPGNPIGRLIGLVLLSMAPATAGAAYDLSWTAIAGGGASNITGGNYSLGSTVSQAAAGPLSGGSYSLHSGFWQADAIVPPGSGIDIDGDNHYYALTDGLLMSRYLFGLQGNSLTNGVVAAGAPRGTAEAIAQYMAGILPLLDVDGNTQKDAATDGLLLLRYLFGLRGESLVAGALGVDATKTAAQIEQYIQSLMP